RFIASGTRRRLRTGDKHPMFRFDDKSLLRVLAMGALIGAVATALISPAPRAVLGGAIGGAIFWGLIWKVGQSTRR
ncbi:MAG: hypothetical protein WCC36_18185, partial [Gammaproteobacteria bacterium]